MINNSILPAATEQLLAIEPDFLNLKASLAALKSLLLRLSGLDIAIEENRQDLYLPTGKAIGPTWAASCLDDVLRTRTYVRGLAAAIREKQAEGRKPVHVLYAGCGPFATLALPLLLLYPPDELQFTLIEINPGSYQAVCRVIDQLGVSAYFAEIHQANAASIQMDNGDSFDILLSETMQAALMGEQQVSIMGNLDAQLSSRAICVPESIDLFLGLARFGDQSFMKLDKILSLNRKSLGEIRAQHGSKLPQRLFEGRIRLPDGIGRPGTTLAILTRIRTYGQEMLDVKQSGLTVPLVIDELSRFSGSSLIFNYWYEMSTSPGIRFLLETPK